MFFNLRKRFAFPSTWIDWKYWPYPLKPWGLKKNSLFTLSKLGSAIHWNTKLRKYCMSQTASGGCAVTGQSAFRQSASRQLIFGYLLFGNCFSAVMKTGQLWIFSRNITINTQWSGPIDRSILLMDVLKGGAKVLALVQYLKNHLKRYFIRKSLFYS